MKSIFSITSLFILIFLIGCVPKNNEIIRAYGEKDYVKVRHLTSQELKHSDDKLMVALNAWSHYQLGQYDLALKGFKRVQKIAPNFFHGYIGEAWVSLKLLDYKRAEKAINHAEQWMGQHQRGVLFASRGWLAFYQGDLINAAKWFDKTESSLYQEDDEYYSIDPTIRNTWATLPWVGRGWIALSENNYSASEKAFKQGISWDDSCHLCYSGMVDLYWAQARWDDAFNAAIDGLKVVRHDPELVRKLNKILNAKQDPNISVQVYKELVNASKNDPLYLTMLGYAYYNQGNMSKAKSVFNEALKINPKQVWAVKGLQTMTRNKQ